jgi:predicted aspartyl protease
MITGIVTGDGVPVITLEVAGESWPAIIDTGFNGDVELPDTLRSNVNAVYVGRVTSALASGQSIEEDVYLIDFPFDGKQVRAQATFVSGTEILVGTRILADYRLVIDFPARTLAIDSG